MLCRWEVYISPHVSLYCYSGTDTMSSTENSGLYAAWLSGTAVLWTKIDLTVNSSNQLKSQNSFNTQYAIAMQQYLTQNHLLSALDGRQKAFWLFTVPYKGGVSYFKVEAVLAKF